MAQALRRKDTNALEAVLAAQGQKEISPIPMPPTTLEDVKSTCDSLLLTRFTATDAWDLGHLLYARLLPFATHGGKPTVISITLANKNQILFQTAVGSGTLVDNQSWVERKRNSVLRYGCSTWALQCKYKGDEEAFRKKFGMSEESAGMYAIHGGGVPIRVEGVEGIVAVVVVSGLKQEEDHGVIFDVVRQHWE